VEFREGTTVLGTGTLNETGVATFTTSTLSAGTRPVTAYYMGDKTGADNFSASNSAPAYNQKVGLVNPPSQPTPPGTEDTVHPQPESLTNIENLPDPDADADPEPVLQNPVAPLNQVQPSPQHPVMNVLEELDPLPIVEETPNQALIRELAERGVPILTIGDLEVPLIAFPGMSAWAILNLVFSLLGILIAGVTIYRVREQKRLERLRADYQKDNESGKYLRRRAWIIPAIILAVFGLVFFTMTEDAKALMVLIYDQWTPVNTIAFVGVAVTARLAIRQQENDEQELPSLQAM